MAAAASASDFRQMHDVVMGGVSLGSLTASTKRTFATFAGTVRLENRGGFASVRAPLPAGSDLSGSAGIELVVRSESGASEMQLTLKDKEARETQVAFKGLVPLTPGFETVRVRWADLRPEFRGRAIERDALKLTEVCELGLLVKAPAVVGDFAIDVERISAFRE